MWVLLIHLKPPLSSLYPSFFFFSFVRWKLQSPRWRWQCIAGPSGFRTFCGLWECGLARFPFWVARRCGRTAVDVLLSDCQYRKGTALYGQYGVWNTLYPSNNCELPVPSLRMALQVQDRPAQSLPYPQIGAQAMSSSRPRDYHGTGQNTEFKHQTELWESSQLPPLQQGSEPFIIIRHSLLADPFHHHHSSQHSITWNHSHESWKSFHGHSCMITGITVVTNTISQTMWVGPSAMSKPALTFPQFPVAWR